MSVGGDDETVAGSAPTIAEPGMVDELVANRYRIVRWLGGGGMGRVYEALDTELDVRVALKVLKSGLSEEAVERFRREVRLTRKIQHTNFARMFDIGDHGQLLVADNRWREAVGLPARREYALDPTQS